MEHNQQRIYSFVGNDKMTIQGFALPFSEEITIPIGVSIPTAGNYKIGIAAVDGMFTNTPVFLADLLLNTVTDITNQPYSFYAEANEINNRFVLQFTNTLLSNTDFIADFNEVVVENNPLRITSSRELIKEIEIYDVLGRKLFEKKNINALQVEGSSLIPTNNLILIKVKLNSNKTIVKKTLF
ncbi:T9SS sorting signal type C domain-containing protein [Flavobacterium sp. NRK F7]|uniref:T9SS sorting signal type C domain-containing protein n=1 Tax=Flavobacterium sp. NRK F7 TaxID=2954930 RepID=UPI002090B49D|nr:T9SS sorting signal type C domain-containing protein [Flavobacterium sp. NRK F7]MCO6161934.1 T9SS sorting signal type C domain-containing protein [Flavobacterium sp. NRK F7]